MVCQSPAALHYSAMKPALWLPFSSALILILTGCASNDPSLANDPLGTGPFDSQGRYREEWADDPTKWRRPGKRQETPAVSDDLPVIAQNEQPPANANPLSTQTTKRVESTPRETPVRTQTQKATSTTPKPTPTLVKATPKPKPTVVKAKPKPKPKPKSTRYVVKKGDSLSTIASRNGSSVSAIQRANGISGTLIRPGQSLVIPKR